MQSGPLRSSRWASSHAPAFGEHVQAIAAAQAEAAQARLITIFDQWERVDDLHDPAWARLYALTAIWTRSTIAI